MESLVELGPEHRCFGLPVILQDLSSGNHFARRPGIYRKDLGVRHTLTVRTLLCPLRHPSRGTYDQLPAVVWSSSLSSHRVRITSMGLMHVGDPSLIRCICTV